jgi:hypothetical protein
MAGCRREPLAGSITAGEDTDALLG